MIIWTFLAIREALIDMLEETIMIWVGGEQRIFDVLMWSRQVNTTPKPPRRQHLVEHFKSHGDQFYDSYREKKITQWIPSFNRNRNERYAYPNPPWNKRGEHYFTPTHEDSQLRKKEGMHTIYVDRSLDDLEKQTNNFQMNIHGNITRGEFFLTFIFLTFNFFLFAPYFAFSLQIQDNASFKCGGRNNFAFNLFQLLDNQIFWEGRI